ncbi:NAD(P)-binding domain-containing protein [Streptomyces sp. NBC_01167]|uniref:NAD(P)-dependent oxidoreductase n=1 Tax=Streptomyces sp. NBC_01167 TaxID=2903756 RepID=UPI0038665A80|nr:NAD(P)-binding domain-containing protein [Streptomyces sp. NBC_01167]
MSAPQPPVPQPSAPASQHSVPQPSVPQPSAPGSRPPVSVLGLGMMGSALAAAFLAAGHPVTVWNRTRSKTGPLVAQGAVPAGSAAEAVTGGGLAIVCLMTNDNVRELLDSLGESPAGRTVVNLTNGTPAQARELAARATELGIRYIDGGIMAVPQMIGGPHAYVLYSGDEQAFETHRPTLAALGGTTFTGADPGLASLHDLALLTGMYGMVVGVLQAYALVRTEGISATDFSELLVPWVGAMLSGAPQWAAAVDSGEHLTDVSSLAVNQAAVPNFLAAFRDQGITTEFFEPLKAILDRAIEEGHADDGLSRLVDLMRA